MPTRKHVLKLSASAGVTALVFFFATALTIFASSLNIAAEGPAESAFATGRAASGQVDPSQLPGLAAAPSAVAITHWQTIDTSLWSPPSPDPTGIVYLPDSNSLLVTDSELNELPIFTGDNLFETTLSGVLLSTATTTAFADEPTGAEIHPFDGHLLIADDDDRAIYNVDAGSDGIFGSMDDIVGSIDTTAFNSYDPEGVAFDSWLGHLYIVDGLSLRVYRIRPGYNGLFDGVAAAGDDLVTSFDLTVHGVTVAEGIAFNAENGHLYVIGRPANRLFELTADGALIEIYDTSDADPVRPDDLAFAPSSSNPSANSLYITDRGIDSSTNSVANDGRIFEFSLPALPPLLHEPPDVEAGSNQSIDVTKNIALNGIVIDDGLPDPPGTLTTTWSHVYGPGAVDFDDMTSAVTTANFTTPGTYVLRLTADDGELVASDEVTVVVTSSAFLPLNVRAD